MMRSIALLCVFGRANGFLVRGGGTPSRQVVLQPRRIVAAVSDTVTAVSEAWEEGGGRGRGSDDFGRLPSRRRDDYDGGYRERGGYGGGGGGGNDWLTERRNGGGYGGGYRERNGGGYGGEYRGGGGYGGGRGYGGAGARERRAGDWTCPVPSCGANVFGSKSHCYKCGAPNPDPVARRSAGRGRGRGGRGTPPWHPDSRQRNYGRGFRWQGLDGAEDFEDNLADDEAAFRRQFGPALSSGIDFAKYADIPVEIELPRAIDALTDETAPVSAFEDLACGKVLRRNLRFAGFEVPTPVQANSVPVALAGIDVISVAQTGSGKTLAFMLPILKRILAAGSRQGQRGYGGGYRGRDTEAVAIRALVLAPTRELAQQIHKESEKFAFRTGLRIGVAYGGTPFGAQMRELERGCDVLVATPGRVNDMVLRGRVTLRDVEFLVLDEADRMLDMGFEPQIRNLVEGADMPPGRAPEEEDDEDDSLSLDVVDEDDEDDVLTEAAMNKMLDAVEGPKPVTSRQTMMFSATFPKSVRFIADDFLVDPIMLKVGRVGGAATTVKQTVLHVNGWDKTQKAVELLQEVPGKTIIFVNTKRAADMLEDELYEMGTPAASVHGDKDQRQRERALNAFKTGRIDVIIGTDVLGRGIDVPEVIHVINYDAPDDIEDYTHRIGRTGRAGHTGLATTMLNEGNKNIAKDLVHMLTTSKQETPEWLEDMVPRKRMPGRGSGRGRGRGRGGGRGRRSGGGGRYGGGGGYRSGGGGGGGYSGGYTGGKSSNARWQV